MTYKKARDICVACFCTAAAVVVAGVCLFDTRSDSMTIMFAIAAAFLTAGILIRRKYCRCPSCGAPITEKLIGVYTCPYCAADLMPRRNKSRH